MSRVVSQLAASSSPPPPCSYPTPIVFRFSRLPTLLCSVSVLHNRLVVRQLRRAVELPAHVRAMRDRVSSPQRVGLGQANPFALASFRLGPRYAPVVAHQTARVWMRDDCPEPLYFLYRCLHVSLSDRTPNKGVQPIRYRSRLTPGVGRNLANGIVLQDTSRLGCDSS